MPQAQAYYKDNRPIPDEDLGRAIDTGEAYFDADAKVKVVGPKGETWEVSPNKLGEALANGFQVETRQSALEREQRFTESSQRLQQAIDPVELYQGYLEANIAGTTLGLSDPLLVAAGADPAAMAARRANPATLIPELGGAVGAAVAAPMVAGAGGVLGRAGQVATAGGRVLNALTGAGEVLGVRAGTGLAGRTIARGAAGAFEGAAVGMGSEVSRAALEQRPLQAEKLALSGIYGSLLGASGGALGSVATDGLGAVMGSIGRGRTAGSISENLATSGTLHALGATKPQVARLKDPKAMAQTVLNYELKTGELAGQPILRRLDDAKAMLPRLKQAVDEVGGELKSLEDRVSARVTAEGMPLRARDVMREVKAAILRSNPVGPAAQRAANRALKQFTPIARKVEVEDIDTALRFMSDPKLRASYLKRRDQIMRESGLTADQPLSFADLQKLRKENDDLIYIERGHEAGAQAKARVPFLEAGNSVLRRQVSDIAERALGADGLDPGLWQQTNQTLGHLLDASRIASKEVKGSNAATTLLAAEKLLGVAGMFTSLATGSIVPALTAGALGIANRLVKEHGGSVLAATMRQTAKLDRRSDKLAHAIVTGSGMSDLSKGAARRAARIAPVQISKRMGQAERFETDDSVSANDKARFVAATRSLMALQDPAVRINQLGAAVAPIAEENEELAMEVLYALNAGIDRLSSKLPLPSQDFSMQATLDIEYMDGSAIREFLDSLDMLNDPVDALAASIDGELDPMAVELLKEQQPFYWQFLRTKVAQELAEEKDRIPYEKALRLALDFDLPEPSLDPLYVAEIQQTYMARDMMMQEAAASGGKPLTAPKDVNLKTDQLGLS